MKRKVHSVEEIIRILRQADGGETAQAVCREHNISEQTFYRWKQKYGGMDRMPNGSRSWRRKPAS